MHQMLAILALLIATTGTVAAQQAEPTPAARDAAIKKAMHYLDQEIWSLQEYGSPIKQYAVGVAAWAYLLAGDRAPKAKRLPSRTKPLKRMRGFLDRYVESVERDYARNDERERQNPTSPAPPGVGPGGMPPMTRESAMRPKQYVWTLAMAAHFYAESVARGKKSGASKKRLKTTVKLLENAQQPNGGWGHDDARRPGMGLPAIRIPKPGGGHFDYPGTLLAAANCALSGIGVGHRALRSKGAESLARGRKYFGGAQNADGTYPYDPSQKHDVKTKTAMAGGIEVARTTGAVFALLCAGGDAKSAEVTNALAAVDASPELMAEGHGSASMALQFGALLSKARGEEAWKTFRRIYFPRILASQDDAGAFRCVCLNKSPGVTCDTDHSGGGGPGGGDYARQQEVYVTAIYTLILLLDRAKLAAIPTMPPRLAPTTESPAKR